MVRRKSFGIILKTVKLVKKLLLEEYTSIKGIYSVDDFANYLFV